MRSAIKIFNEITEPLAEVLGSYFMNTGRRTKKANIEIQLMDFGWTAKDLIVIATLGSYV